VDQGTTAKGSDVDYIPVLIPRAVTNGDPLNAFPGAVFPNPNAADGNAGKDPARPFREK
jgi:hypothetical protein